MTVQDNELMRRYIYEVTRFLPSKQRSDISMELEELITDMYESKGCNMENVLAELGDPKKFARQYMNPHHYIIGPEYFDQYIFIIKIVVLCVGLSAIISAFFNIDTHDFEVVGFIITIIANTLDNIFAAIGTVTVVFAILQYLQINVNKEPDVQDKQLITGPTDELWQDGTKQEEKKQDKETSSWKPSDLSPVPSKKAMISRADSVISIVVIIALAAFIVFAPSPIGVYYKDNDIVRTIPLFNMEKWNILCPLFLVVFFISLIEEAVKLVTGCYCRLVMVCNVITNCIQLIILTTIFKFLPVWNTDLVKRLQEVYDIKIKSKGDILYYWGTDVISTVVLSMIWIFTIIDIGITVYKTIRYSNK